MEQQSDFELIERASRGDGRAFEVLFNTHHACLFRFAYRLLGSVALAEEITQEAFLALLLHPRRYDASRGPLRTWLFGIARRLALKELRRRPETVLDEDADAVPAAGPDPAERVSSGEIANAVQLALQCLPLLQREALILSEYEGLSAAEIGTVVGADVPAVKSRLHRARERLRETLAPYRATVTRERKEYGSPQR